MFNSERKTATGSKSGDSLREAHGILIDDREFHGSGNSWGPIFHKMDLAGVGLAEHCRAKRTGLAVSRAVGVTVIETVHEHLVALKVKVGLPEEVCFGVHGAEEVAQPLAVSEAVDSMGYNITPPNSQSNYGMSELVVPMLLRDLPSHVLETPCSS